MPHSSRPVTPTTIHHADVTDEASVPGGAFASVAIGSAVSDSVSNEPPHGALNAADLHDDERALADTLSPTRRESFVAGRQALRAAVRRIAPDLDAHPLLRTHRGAPTVPAGFSGSISHKRRRAIAIVAPSDGRLLGVDLEERPRAQDLSRPSIAERILTAPERAALEDLDLLAHREATLLHFALKEAVYKSIDPYVERYVRFTEVELDVLPDGSAVVRLLLPEDAVRDVHVSASWRFDGEYIIAIAQSHPG